MRDPITLTTPDGVELCIQDWPLPQGARRRGAALIIHGMGEHGGRFGGVASVLNEIGIAVRCYDQRGFGKSGGPRAAIPALNTPLDDAKLVFDRLAAEAREAGDRDAPFLIGHSMGGTIAARAATGGWIRPRGLVLSSPALKTRLSAPARLLVAVASRITPNLVLPHSVPFHRLSHDPLIVSEKSADVLCHAYMTPRMLAFVLAAGAQACRDAAKLDVPTLLLIAGDDRLVDPQGAREFAAAMPAYVTLHWYAPLWHDVFNEREPERAQVLGDLRDWMLQQLAGGGN
jgi:alpha-beta hydrolase superfamily lysophospholipase